MFEFPELLSFDTAPVLYRVTFTVPGRVLPVTRSVIITPGYTVPADAPRILAIVCGKDASDIKITEMTRIRVIQ